MHLEQRHMHIYWMIILKRKEPRVTERCIIEKEIMFEHYKDCLFNDKTLIKSQLRFKSDHHNVYTDGVNKIFLSSNDDKRLQIFDRITTYPYGTNVFKVFESEMLYRLNKNEDHINENI